MSDIEIPRYSENRHPNYRANNGITWPPTAPSPNELPPPPPRFLRPRRNAIYDLSTPTIPTDIEIPIVPIVPTPVILITPDMLSRSSILHRIPATPRPCEDEDIWVEETKEEE